VKDELANEYQLDKMLGGTLVTKQSGPEGKPVNTIMLAKKMSLVKEMYFAIMLDRVTMGPLIVACSEGGTSIEDLAASHPEKIIKVPKIHQTIVDTVVQNHKYTIKVGDPRLA